MNLSLVTILVSSLLVSRVAALMPVAQTPPPRINPDPPGCPLELLAVPNVDFDRIQGIWYMQLTSYNLSTGNCDGCWYESWTHNEPNALYMLCCCTKAGAQTCQNDQNGSGKFASTDVSGLYSFTKFGPGEVHNGFIVATDYETYVIYYSCGIESTGREYSNFYAYTRTKEAPAGFDDLVFGFLDESHIDRCVYFHVTQGEGCVYQNGCGNASPQIEPFSRLIG